MHKYISIIRFFWLCGSYRTHLGWFVGSLSCDILCLRKLKNMKKKYVQQKKQILMLHVQKAIVDTVLTRSYSEEYCHNQRKYFVPKLRPHDSYVCRSVGCPRHLLGIQLSPQSPCCATTHLALGGCVRGLALELGTVLCYDHGPRIPQGQDLFCNRIMAL